MSVSPSTIWRWVGSGRLAAYRVGSRKIRIREEDLETVIVPARDGATRRLAEPGWVRYDADEVRRALAETAGSWSDLDADALVAEIHRSRELGSRPARRP